MSIEKPTKTIVTNDPRGVAEVYQEGLNELHIPANTILVESASAVKALTERSDLNVVGGIFDISNIQGRELAIKIKSDPTFNRLRIIYVTTRDLEESASMLPPGAKILEKPFELDQLLHSLNWVTEENN